MSDDLDPEDLEKSPLDRTVQRKLLSLLRNAFPGRIVLQDGDCGATMPALEANAIYLEQLGLCDSGIKYGLDGFPHHTGAAITAKGLDFLEDDGGTSAILGTITVRMHADTLRDLIDARITASPLPDTEKSTLRKHLASLPETVLRSLVPDLVRLGLRHLPDAVT